MQSNILHRRCTGLFPGSRLPYVSHLMGATALTCSLPREGSVASLTTKGVQTRSYLFCAFEKSRSSTDYVVRPYITSDSFETGLE
jgi:hypothetical protein